MSRKSSLARFLTAAVLIFAGLNSFAEGTDKKQEALALLAETYLAGGQNEKAISAYEEIVENEPLNIKARIALAELLSWEKRYSRAIEEYGKVLKADPENREVLGKIAQVYSWSGDFGSSEKYYRELVGTGERNEDILLKLSKTLLWQGKYTEALEFANEAAGIRPSFRASMIRARIFLYSGDNASAEQELEKIMAQSPDEEDIYEARVMLADTYAYGKKFRDAERAYLEILEQNDDMEVKEKLADVLSWDRQYSRALDLYDEILVKKYDPEIHRQKARVLGWARKYGDSEKEYREILKISPEDEVLLEMEAKKANWEGRVKKAIKNYEELLRKETDNLEAMFDLSQVYAYQSMWDSSIAWYNIILVKDPAHFRAREGKEKAVLISEHVALAPSYRYFEADSAGRDMDMRIQEFSVNSRIPLSSKLFLDADYALRKRDYQDHDHTIENEGKLKISYLEGPDWRAGGYYGIAGYSRGPEEYVHLFGGEFAQRLLDHGEILFMYDRERLENNSEVIQKNFVRNKFRNVLAFDITNRLKVRGEYMFASYSDGNFLHEPSIDIHYDITLEPGNLSVRYRYVYKEFRDKVFRYFSPKGFSTNMFTVNWRHFLNKEEIFFGANDIYYDLKYDLAVDSQYIAGHKFSWEANWDVTKKLNFNVRGSCMGSSAGVYKESEVVVGARYYF
ncbi:MAG: tetratricopeptide repeat protein [Candidatus Omnitrophota bacterium]